MYPVSIPMDGSAVNFTLVSNNDNLDFGIVACRKSVPQVQRLIDYMEESLVELEDAAGIRRRKTAARSKPRLKAKTTGKRKARPKQAATKK